jgi:ABC-type Na+ efflux pump permease subunit
MGAEKLNLFLQPRTDVAVLPIENKSILTADRSDLSLMASRIIEGVDDGLADPLDTYLMAKKGAYVFDGIIEALKGKVQIPEGKNYSKHHCAIREQTTGVKYFFDECNDPVWTSLNEQAQALALQLKEREKWLKTFTKPTQVEAEVDEESGEEIAPERVVFPPAKIGGQSIIVNIKTAKEDED